MMWAAPAFVNAHPDPSTPAPIGATLRTDGPSSVRLECSDSEVEGGVTMVFDSRRECALMALQSVGSKS